MCAVAADRGFTWSDEETTLLLKLWGRNDAQSELTGNKRNFVVYEKISETMNKMGFTRTASQCREKIKRMKREYTLTKQHNEKPNGSKKSMRFFEQFEKILIEKQNKNSKSRALKSSQDISTFSLDEMLTPKKNFAVKNECKMRNIEPKIEQTTKEETLQKVQQKVTTHDTDDSPWAPDVVLVEEDGPSSLLDHQSRASTTSANGDLPVTKKRKVTSRKTFFKSIMNSLTLKFMKYQADSDARILGMMEELENERNATDERIQKMWLEFEEKRSADDREHELNIMSTFQKIASQVKNNQASK